MITLVVGNMRCGSSLVMRMLGAAGAPLLYTQPESFEHEGYRRFIAGDKGCAWLQDGCALKWLDPLLHGWPPARFVYRAIVLTRDPGEQARSQRQFLGVLADVQMNRVQVRQLATSLRRDNARLLAALNVALPGTPALSVRFEDLIVSSVPTAAAIAHFVDLSDRAAVMAAQVKARSVACHPGLMELTLVKDATLWHGEVGR